MADPDFTSKESTRISFLDDLRAIAIMLVVWGHIFVVGVNDPKTLKIWLPYLNGNVFGPNAPAENWHAILNNYAYLLYGVSSGGLGVAIFFLISGFIILRSVDRQPPGAFLVQRAFRIFPLCATAAALTAVVAQLAAQGDPSLQPHSVFSVAASSFAMSGVLHTFAALPVLWSLTVEILFYVLMACAAATGRIGFRKLIGGSAGCVAVIWLVNTPTFVALVPNEVAYQAVNASSMLVHVTFMFVGSALYRGVSDGRREASILYAAALFGLYVAGFTAFKTMRGYDLGATLADCVTALGVFVVVRAAHLPTRLQAFLVFVAAISYPLYLVHTPIGWALQAWLGENGFNQHWAGLGAVIAVVALAWGLHVAVERPSQMVGKKIAGGRKSMPAVPSTAHYDLLDLLYKDKPELKKVSAGE